MVNLNAIWQSGIDGTAFVMTLCAVLIMALSAMAALIVICGGDCNESHTPAPIQETETALEPVTLWFACGPIRF